jgi:hypothetical protein
VSHEHHADHEQLSSTQPARIHCILCGAATSSRQIRRHSLSALNDGMTQSNQNQIPLRLTNADDRQQNTLDQSLFVLERG